MLRHYGVMALALPIFLLFPTIHVQAEEKAKVPPANEGLVPYAFSQKIETHLNPPFPFALPSSKTKGLNPTPKEDYKSYWKKWKPLWSAIDSFNTLFSQADAGVNSISVQYLSARISNFLLLYQQSFSEETDKLTNLESYKRLRSMAHHLEALRVVLQKQGRIYTELRPFQNDVDEETLAYQRLFLQVRQDLATIQEYREVSQVLTTGFRKTDH